MPGVINAHVHSNESDGVKVNYRNAGVTSTCNTAHSLGSFSSFGDPYGASVSSTGRAFNSGPFIGPSPNGYPFEVFGSQLLFGINGASEAIAAVDQLIDSGAEYIKVSLEPDWDGTGNPPFPILDSTELNAIVTRAHERGVLVKAHISDGDQVTVALSAGVDSFEHIPHFPGVDVGSASNIPFGQLFSSSVTGVAEMRATLDQMVAAGVILSPTILVMNNEVPWTRQSPTGTVSVYQEVVHYFASIGGRISLGTDAPLGESGMPMNELQLMLASGLSNLQLVTSMTYNAAISCGQQNMIGSLEVGKLGDVIIVNGNPLTDINAMSNVSTVIVDGVRVGG